MKRLIPLLLFLALLLQPAHASPQLRLSASVTRSEFLAGETFTIDAHLFNDGDVISSGDITVAAPAGFEPLSSDQVAGAIPAGGVLSLWSSYRVAGAVVGLHTFVVRGGGQIREIVIRVGPVRAPPARPPGWRIYLPIAL